MKIGIVTIYRCYNYGSFYQAYGLQKYLQDLGHTVDFIPIDTLYNKKYRLRKQFNRDLSRDLFSVQLIGKYIKDWKLLNIANKKCDDYDVIIIGSDEIWNIKNKTFSVSPEYYGANLNCENIFSYASCVGRSRLEDFKNHSELTDSIKNLKNVSARDDVTEEFLTSIFEDKKIQRVIDPSFLIDWSKIEKNIGLNNYILVYTYDGSWGFSEEYIQAAKEFAKSVSLPLISVGFKNDWCDKSVACSPREFLGYLRNASYVITDTFHGTAMSLQYEKQFISMGKGKHKVESLLKDFNLLNRIYNSDFTIESITQNRIDYNDVNKTIAEQKELSKQYLIDNIS